MAKIMPAGAWFLALLTGCVHSTNREEKPYHLHRTGAAHHSIGAPVQAPDAPSRVRAPERGMPAPPAAPSLEQVETAIRTFQKMRKSPGPSMDTAWPLFLDVVFAYVEQPAEYLHFSPLIRARVAAEFELDAEQRRPGGAPEELERLVGALLERIDYQVRKIRSLSGTARRTLSLAMDGESRRLRWPLACGLITSGFGHRKDPMNPTRTEFHSGIDLAAPPFEPVYAAAAGTVIAAGWGGNAGRMVRIRHHGKQETLYGHLASILVKKDQEVSRGQIIGLLGRTGRATGHHLHFAVFVAGQGVNPMEHLQAVPLGFSDISPGIVFGTADPP
jgi:murein DD-endopeptidase MepM/ murein hydrolase activator NlpD